MHGFRPAVPRSSSLAWENFAPRQARDKVLVAKTGGGGSRTPVRKALRLEAYMLIAFDLFRQPRLERARRAAG
jgi:hypothetical protein